MSKIDQIHHAACSVQNNVEDVEDIKTSHNRFQISLSLFHYCQRHQRYV